MSPRTIRHRYQDPVDVIWTTLAFRLGMLVERSHEVYASWDGKRTLRIAAQEHFDPDDSLAQMIFHEVCHSLVAGELASRPDWGLSNTDGRDLLYEHACHRVQAALAAPYGLRQFMAVTTEWRPYWDGLPNDPLAPGDDPAIGVAQRAFERSKREPLHGALHAALEATARIAEVTRPFADPDSLWSQTMARHSTGFLLGHVAGRTCGDCTWSFKRAGRSWCRRSARAGLPARAVLGSEAACELWEAQLTEQDCKSCGACCRQGFDLVEVRPSEPFRKHHPELTVRTDAGYHVPRPEGRCVALSGQGTSQQPYLCKHYSDRPKSCADFPIAGDACLLARRRVGLSRS